MMTPADLPDSCTAAEAAGHIASLAGHLAPGVGAPSLRTLRLWRSKGVLSDDGRGVTRKNMLEALGILRLRAEGLALAAAAERCRALDEGRLLAFLSALPAPAAGGERAGAFARDTLQLLAQGILEQFALVAGGAIVGHIDRRPGGGEGTPRGLRQAAARLGRLYLEEGREDQAASVHALLVRCMTPLAGWAPGAVAALPGAAGAVLIDPDLRVPSEDCCAIAQPASGAGIDDIVEHRLHRELMQTLARLGDEADVAAAYATVREFVGRHPLATGRELQGLYAHPDLPTPAVAFVQALYVPVHADLAAGGHVSRCRRCRALAGRDGRCTLPGCRDDHPHTALGEPVPAAAALVAQPAVLKYWADPAREELRLYDGLVRLGIPATLYPHADRCDVAIGDRVGVDVKDYRDPARLASVLNRGLGGLAGYPRAIVAIADRRARAGDYLPRLREQLLPEHRRRLEILSVTGALRALRRDHRQRRGE